jgi:ABC-type Mn2+/Zn2+ transport system permease subunit
VHIVFKKKFFDLTERYENGEAKSIHTFNVWNFLFYITIGLSIVFAVRINGVVPVFSYLIIPAVGAILITQKKSGVLILALFISVIGAFIGLNVSYHYDFPAGSSVVAMLGAVFFVAAIVKGIKNAFLKKEK